MRNTREAYRPLGQCRIARGGGGGAGRCCANRHGPARCPPTGSSPADAIRHWSAEGGHPIQDLAAEDGLTPLPSWTPGAKGIADDGLVAEQRIFHPALTMVPRHLLPTAPAELLHPRDRPIPRGRPRAVARYVRRLSTPRVSPFPRCARCSPRRSSPVSRSAPGVPRSVGVSTRTGVGSDSSRPAGASRSQEYRAWSGLVQHAAAVGADLMTSRQPRLEAQYYQQAKVAQFNEFGLRNSRYDPVRPARVALQILPRTAPV